MATKLYTPEVLRLATSLSGYPWDESQLLKGHARSKSCGSTIDLSLSTDDQGVIRNIGIRSQACAIGQAAAAIFANAAAGQNSSDIRRAGEAIEAWLSGTGPMPDWPGLDVIAEAREYPARHGAIMLAWKAARDVLPS